MARSLRVFTVVRSVVLLVILGLAATIGYQFVASRLAAGVYRDRLRDLVAEHQRLRDLYNEAVRRTAVTELIVEGGKLSVAIRTADGQERIIPTPFDPTGEIYVDYALRDGRLYIRRIFDDKTAPARALVVDPEQASIDWTAPGNMYGKAVYRALAEGRWVVTVTGDGSLALTRHEQADRPQLEPAPQVKDYAQIEGEIEQQLDTIGPIDVLKYVFTGSPQSP